MLRLLCGDVCPRKGKWLLKCVGDTCCCSVYHTKPTTPANANSLDCSMAPTCPCQTKLIPDAGWFSIRLLHWHLALQFDDPRPYIEDITLVVNTSKEAFAEAQHAANSRAARAVGTAAVTTAHIAESAASTANKYLLKPFRRGKVSGCCRCHRCCDWECFGLLRFQARPALACLCEERGG